MRKSQFTSLYGQKFNRLTAIYPTNTNAVWVFKCECGKEKELEAYRVVNSQTKSCGCLKLKLKHGMTGTTEFRSWACMKARCYNKKATGYNDYGGRGITVCDRWRDKKNGFINFLADLGLKPGPSYTLDRINNNGNYEPLNCKWATKSEQVENRRSYGVSVIDHCQVTALFNALVGRCQGTIS